MIREAVHSDKAKQNEEKLARKSMNDRKKKIVSFLCGVNFGKYCPDGITYNELVKPFKIEYDWLTPNILRKHVHTVNKMSRSVNKPQLPLVTNKSTSQNVNNNKSKYSYTHEGKEY